MSIVKVYYLKTCIELTLTKSLPALSTKLSLTNSVRAAALHGALAANVSRKIKTRLTARPGSLVCKEEIERKLVRFLLAWNPFFWRKEGAMLSFQNNYHFHRTWCPKVPGW